MMLGLLETASVTVHPFPTPSTRLTGAAPRRVVGDRVERMLAAALLLALLAQTGLVIAGWLVG